MLHVHYVPDFNGWVVRPHGSKNNYILWFVYNGLGEVFPYQNFLIKSLFIEKMGL